VDADPYCINRLYNKIKATEEKNIQPMVIDLANPTPAIGVNNNERQLFFDRINTDLALALALVHHLAIGRNIPIDMIAQTFRRISKYLVIEFVPKSDDKIRLMLQRKKDIYMNYDEASFIQSFEKYFSVIDKKDIGESGRTLYLMKRHEG
jgi:hypothetical protein